MKFSRREAIAYLSNLMGTAGVYPLLSSSLAHGQASGSKDEHFFLFVELKGGVHHTVTTDYPDIDAINRIAAETTSGAIMKFPLDDNHKSFFDNMQVAEKYKLKDLVDLGPESKKLILNGYFCALPYDEKNPDAYYYQSPQDSNMRLGPAALALADHMDKISVLRGVQMEGTFHGVANEEIYTGNSSQKGIHLAGVLAQLLEQGRGKKPLDNLVLGGASYPTASTEAEVKAAVQVPYAAIRALTGKVMNSDLPFAHAKRIAQAWRARYGLNASEALSARMHRIYLDAFADAETAKQKLADILKDTAVNKIATNDSNDKRSLRANLGSQLDICLALFRSGLSRVLTICSGGGLGFGGFDSHMGMYHDFEYEGVIVPSFFKLTKLTMDDLAKFITFIHNEDYDKERKWKDVLTVVVSSEFGRSNNFSGGFDQDGRFGNDHYYFNNNYIFMGKGVNTGQWLGKSDPVTRFPHVIDFSKLSRAGSQQDIENAFEDPVKVAVVNPNKERYDKKIEMVTLKDGYSHKFGTDTGESGQPIGVVQSDNLDSDLHTKRALMAKDVVRTLMAIAGHEDEFRNYYSDSFFVGEQDPAHVIKQLVNK